MEVICIDNKCEHIKEIIIEYINKELSDHDKVYFFSHIISCKACRKELALFNDFKRQVVLAEEKIPENLSSEIFNSIINEISEKVSEQQKITIGAKITRDILQNITRPDEIIRSMLNNIIYLMQLV